MNKKHTLTFSITHSKIMILYIIFILFILFIASNANSTELLTKNTPPLIDVIIYSNLTSNNYEILLDSIQEIKENLDGEIFVFIDNMDVRFLTKNHKLSYSSDTAERFKALQKQGVLFCISRRSLNNDISSNDLYEFIHIVKSIPVEIAYLQSKGFKYIPISQAMNTSDSETDQSKDEFKSRFKLNNWDIE